MKICDFGLSKILHGKGFGHTQTFGTFEYMSPEARKTGKFGFQTDVW